MTATAEQVHNLNERLTELQTACANLKANAEATFLELKATNDAQGTGITKVGERLDAHAAEVIQRLAKVEGTLYEHLAAYGVLAASQTNTHDLILRAFGGDRQARLQERKAKVR